MSYGVWKSQKKSHFTTWRAKHFVWNNKYGQFWSFGVLRAKIVTRQVNLKRTKIGGKMPKMVNLAIFLKKCDIFGKFKQCEVFEVHLSEMEIENWDSISLWILWRFRHLHFSKNYSFFWNPSKTFLRFTPQPHMIH